MEGRTRRALLLLVLASTGLTAAWQQPAGAAARVRRANACIFDRTGMKTAPGECRPRARAYPPSVKGKVKRAVYDGALTFGIPYTVLLAIARCESGLRPRAAFGGHFGLYQFLPDTFKSGAAGLRRETGITAHSYWNPLDASYVAGYLFATGQSGEWSCEQALG